MSKTKGTSKDVESPQIPLENSMAKKLENLGSLSPECTIYKVPEWLRRAKKNAYIPKIVSIGPLYHGRKRLKPMEEHKMRYLRDFLKRTNKDLKFFIDIIRANEAKLRGCYAKTIKYSNDKFVKIILVDAAFIVEVLLKSYNPQLQDESDRIFKKPWLIQGLWLDMLLLENQLPFFILEDLLGFYDREACFQDETLTISMLTVFFFKPRMEMEGMTDRWAEIFSSKVKLVHFVHLLRHLRYPMKESVEGGKQLRTLTVPTVTMLYRAGVRFKVRASKDLFDIQFNKGILEIPKIIFSDVTEQSIWNSIAFEQCHYLDNHINDYVIILTRLVNSAGDVELLVKNGILENRFSQNKEVSKLLNKLANGTVLEEKNFYFANLSDDLNAYYKKSWHKWKATLRQKYFSNPWTSISVIAVAVALILDIIQVVYSAVPQMQNSNRHLS